MDPFKHISLDVRQLISISEKIHSAALRGMALNHEELEIVRECAKELLGLTRCPNGMHDYAVNQPNASSSKNV